MELRPIIVVGTTPDYVTRIQKTESTKPLLFLLDLKYRSSRELNVTENSHFIFSDLENYNETLEILKEYVSGQDNKPGFACFDCESLFLASRLAEYFNSPFPLPDAVLKSRNKFLSGRLWIKDGVATPECELASDLAYSLELFNRFGRNTVLKPLTGSGSELVFHCTEEQDIINAVETLIIQLEMRRGNPLFALIMDPVSEKMIDPCRLWIVEKFVDGPEYSCDFFMNNGTVYILRETGKIKDRDCPFGTISGYTIPRYYPEGRTGEDLKFAMKKAAEALGFTWGYFMADYIVCNDRMNMLELTPRPGGDSLPELIKESTGVDILGYYLDIASGNTPPPAEFPCPAGSYTSVHLYSDREGVIDDIDTKDITGDPRIRLLLLKKNRGDSVSLPPGDYDNRLIGYCVVSSDADDSLLMICKEIQSKIKVKYTAPN